MEVSQLPIPTRLNIGSGTEVIPGYVSVDLFIGADIQDDIRSLSKFSDNSVDEIRIFHILEHLALVDVEKAIASMYRVLRSGGKLILEVPDLIWLMQDFLDTPESDRWGWKIQTIFGLQNHEGEYHRTGFSAERMGRLLVDAGFIKVAVDPVFSKTYNQGIIDAVCSKP